VKKVALKLEACVSCCYCVIITRYYNFSDTSTLYFSVWVITAY